jgi:hypothetical protein
VVGFVVVYFVVQVEVVVAVVVRKLEPQLDILVVLTRLLQPERQ